MMSLNSVSFQGGVQSAADNGRSGGGSPAKMKVRDSHNHRDVTSKRFLLKSKRAEKLYQAIAKDPVVDYHTHICPNAMANNLQFENITQVLLGSTKSGSPVFDHYFARVLDQMGVPDEIVRNNSGDVDDKERFKAIAQVFPELGGNPTYQWVRMIFKQYFGVSEELNADNAEAIYDKCKAKLAKSEFSIRGLMDQKNIQICATTDDPTHTLEHHDRYNADTATTTKLLPTWRPDRILAIKNDRRNDFMKCIKDFEAISDDKIENLGEFLEVIDQRHKFFHEKGCRVADIGLANFVSIPCTDQEASDIFEKRLTQGDDSLNPQEIEKYQSFMLKHLAELNAEKGWVQQFHQGPARDANGQLYEEHGADCGGDYIGDPADIPALSSFLDELNSEDKLAKTIIYPLNDASYKPVLSLAGSFQQGGTSVLLGVPWWFNDTEEGNRSFIKLVAEQSVLSEHIGMLSDSRSPLSAGIRFDYFRRVLADELVEMMPEKSDEELARIAHKIAYKNAAKFFNWEDKIKEAA